MGWYFLYTNEAHPGEFVPAHVDLEAKFAAAERLRDEIGIERDILVDALDGPVHRAYGSCPNMTYVVGKGGVILYKAMWTSADRVEEFVASLEGMNKPGSALFYTEQVEIRRPDRERFLKDLERNGPRSRAEFERAGEIWAERARAEARARRGGEG